MQVWNLKNFRPVFVPQLSNEQMMPYNVQPYLHKALCYVFVAVKLKTKIMNNRVLKENERIVKFRSWKDGKMEYSHRMPDVKFWESNNDIFKIELMQFTGKKDCKGIDVYEGDIVKYFSQYVCYKHPLGDEKAEIIHLHTDAYGTKTLEKFNPLIGIVQWNNKYQAYEPLIDKEYDYDHVSFLLVCYDEHYCKNEPMSSDDDNSVRSYYEVIGNIYENHELVPSKPDEETDGSHDT